MDNWLATGYGRDLAKDIHTIAVSTEQIAEFLSGLQRSGEFHAAFARIMALDAEIKNKLDRLLDGPSQADLTDRWARAEPDETGAPD